MEEMTTKQFEKKLTPEELAAHKATSLPTTPAHIFRDDSYGFEYQGTSEELKLLSASSKIYVSLKVKRLELLAVCKRKGVKFTDLQRHLLNQAKESGLWPKGASEKHCHRFEWYVQIIRFCQWSWRNFLDYGKEVPTVSKVKTPEKVKTVVVRTSKKPVAETSSTKAAPAKVAPPPEPTSQGSGEVTTDSAGRPEAIQFPETVATPSAGVFDKIIESLSPLQVQTIIFKNLSVLGHKAQELGAVTEFNLLMEALGLIHEMIPETTATTALEEFASLQ